VDQPEKPKFGQYILLAELGRGTTGIVHKAQHSLAHTLVALKTIEPVVGVDMRVQVARLHREAKILANLASTLEPNTPTVYEVGELEGRPYYCREFVNGQTLENAVKHGSINRRGATNIVTTLVKTLARVHGRGILHRNLAANNVLVTAEGIVKLIGFGLAAPIQSDSSKIRIAEDVKLVGQMLAWVSSQTVGPSTELLKLILRRCTLEELYGGYGGVLLLLDDLERYTGTV